LVGTVVAGTTTIQYMKTRRANYINGLRMNCVEKPWAPRNQNIALLKSGKEFDLLVLGGGATGCGAALDAQTRGLSVALLEKEDFASGTSSRSTKLIWAGSRYLVLGLVKLFSLQLLWSPVKTVDDFMGTFKMVLGCHRERRSLIELNPHLITWLPIAVPLDRWLIWPPPFDYPPAMIGPLGVFPAFFKFYDFLGGFCSPSSYVMSSSRAKEEFPQLAARPNHTLKYVNVFYEGTHNDARTNLAIGLTAAKHGACVTNYTEVMSMIFDDQGKAIGAKVKDVASGDVFDVKSKTILYCGGPYTDSMRKMSEGEDCKKCVKGATGTHIVLPGYFTPKDMGFVDMQTSDGRFLFVLNWQNHTLVGTTDSKTDEIELHQRGTEEEIQWILNEAKKYLDNSTGLERKHVLSAWQGTRPLVNDPNADPSATSGASRDHTISHHKETGITFISGGKWTTYREMAEDAIDHILDTAPESVKAKAGPCVTLETPLIGAGPTDKAPIGWHRNLKYELCSEYAMSIDIADHLAKTYGTRAHDVMAFASSAEESLLTKNKEYGRLIDGYPYIEPEIRYALHKEYAVTAYDIVARRTRLAFLNINAAKTCLPNVVEVMGKELGWSNRRKSQELQDANKVLDANFNGPEKGVLSGIKAEGVTVSKDIEQTTSGLAFG
jgi:glycerol-3-phosphate dehydrogenase